MKRWMCSGTDLRNTPQTTWDVTSQNTPKEVVSAWVWRLEHVCRAGGKILKLLYKTTWEFLKVCKVEPPYDAGTLLANAIRERRRQSLKRRVIPTSTRAMEWKQHRCHKGANRETRWDSSTQCLATQPSDGGEIWPLLHTAGWTLRAHSFWLRPPEILSH